MTKKLGITELVLRDGNQSLLATRLRLDDMLPIADKLDKVGFWSLETWGGATFDACIRYLGEDPWERLRQFKAAMPNTPQQMLLRGQNLLGYRHYADDVVEKFVERAAVNGVDVFRVFDAMNDVRNVETAIRAVVQQDKHAQGTLCYTTSPVHSIDTWVDMAKRLADLGCHSLAIKDMAGLLNPYDAEKLVKALKSAVDLPLALHSHATTGMSVATLIKGVDAGVDVVDTCISSMSMTYSHSATESIVAILQQGTRDSGLDLKLLEDISAYFRQVRRKYAQFEGTLQGIDSRILVAQVPGGMLTNMENQLREQQASERLDEVLAEIPNVRKDLGYLPLVTPTSQIVGTQAVLNVLQGEGYKTITKETAAVLKGEYGKAPAEVNAALQKRVLDGETPITCRPADLLAAEFDVLSDELRDLEKKEGIESGEGFDDDVLTYALFGQTGLSFLKNRGDDLAFEPAPCEGSVEASVAVVPVEHEGVAHYLVKVDGHSYDVEVSAYDEACVVERDESAQIVKKPCGGDLVTAPLTGNVVSVVVKKGQSIKEGDVVIVLEAMKMETEVCASKQGVVNDVFVDEGQSVAVGDALLNIA